jgi:2-dehydro-3-deoxy-D-arabinonate dehydratase
MRLGQIKWNGGVTAAIFNHSSARPIPDYTLCELISRAEKQGALLADLAEELSIPKPVAAEPLIPIQPREVWASEEILAHEPRPRIFLKGTARMCVGPGQPIGIRSDSRFTAPEPEIAVVLGARGRVLGYTLANDVSARDIERENPLYLSQSKTFQACCALGPIMVTADEIADPLGLTVSCTIVRAGATVFEGKISTERLALSRMLDFLMRANPVPPGSVLLTGTGVRIENVALMAGDSVSIRVDQIGELRNPAEVVGSAICYASSGSSNSSSRAASAA